MGTQRSANSEGPLRTILVALAIALLAGGSAPWWLEKLFLNPTAAPAPPLIQSSAKTPAPECSAETLRSQFLHAASDKSGVMKTSARTMRQKLNLRDFDCVSGLATVLLEADQNNGHGLYFLGEALRAKATQDPKNAGTFRGQMRTFLFRYLDIEGTLTPADRHGNAEACYQRDNGYCAERTAWINHLLANDYYQLAQDKADKEIKLSHLRRALQFVDQDLQFGGFDQIRPSSALKRMIQLELDTLHSAVTPR